MSSKFFCSLTVLSFAVCHFLSADVGEEEDLFEEVYFEVSTATVDENKTEESSEFHRRAAFPVKNTPVNLEQKTTASEETEKQPPPKKIKPHYAGARRPPEKVKVDEPAKKNNSHVKNKWFSSKTHPKLEKKGTTEAKETPIELPADRPHYTKTSHTEQSHYNFKPGFTSDASTESPPPMRAPNQAEEDYYPRAGFQAPNGHLYFTGEWLYWRTRQEGMEYVTTKKVDFDFQSGFRVGLGVHLPYDRWDVYVNYTRFNPEDSDRVQGSFYPLYLFQGAGIQGSHVTHAHAQWEIEFQSVDVEIGRAFYLAKTLVFRPFFGLKGSWIDQEASIRYSGGFIPVGQTFRTHFENDFKGAGPLIGIESNWLIGAGFSFFADLAASLVIGHFDMRQEQRQLGGAEVVALNSDFNLACPTLQMVAGLAWDRNFNRERWHLGLSAGFESQYWWSQNQMEQFTDKDFPIYRREKGDLAFYGLTLRGRFDF